MQNILRMGRCFGFRPRSVILFLVFALVANLALLSFLHNGQGFVSLWRLPHQGPPKADSVQRVPCYGPRGKLLSESPDDALHHTELKNVPYPKPLAGSHDALGLRQTWQMAEDRYGPYGWTGPEGALNPIMNNRSPVNWEELNWAHLQDDCVARNADRFQRVRNATDAVRFELCRDERQIPGLHRSYPNTFLPRAPDEKSGRTAIVMRSWDIYSYGPEIMAHLRSMLVEAALAASGDYTLFLLVHVRDPERRIHDNATQYQAALDEFVPKELQPIAVLFDGHLLESWYPKIGEHRVELQIFQALQLFAHFYDEFDHYWQLEMDVRYTGDTREYLDSMSRFAREEPRKQSRERASYAYIPEVHGSYRDFFSAVNATLEGGGMWGAEKIKDFAPIGPQPPTKTPQEDNFEWGVGEDADLIVTGQCTDVRMMEDWVYRGWIHNFEDGGDTPRTTCPPAIARASWNLLNAIHTAQFEKGLHLPSEATLPSFAMWHGLKFSYPPQPWYQLPQQDPVAMDKFFNGGKINPDKGGMAYGEAMYNGHWHFDISNTATWWWGSDFPSVIMRSWLGKEPLKKEGQEEDPTKQAVPYILHKDEQGRIWAPNLALHPYKA